MKKLCLFLTLLALSACSRTAPLGQSFVVPTSIPTATTRPSATPLAFYATRAPGTPVVSPTPDQPHPLPTQRTEQDTYTVETGDTLGKIAVQYGVSIDALVTANSITNPDNIAVGLVLTIPAPPPEPPGPDFKIIPDSELVNSPSAVGFNVKEFAGQYGGYLSLYSGDVDGETLDGPSIIARVARDYSVNPRLLLAVLEFQTQWISNNNPDPKTLDYPMAFYDENYKGLYRQAAFVADRLNRGYYLWKVNGLSSLVLADDAIVPLASKLNAGTVGVQYLMSLFYGKADWEYAVTEQGLFSTYQSMFGFPFDYSIDPLVPPDLTQPTMQLPFEKGVVWAFTGGPHGGWGSGSAWAALDFAPPGDEMGCVQSDDWVVAVAPGVIVRSDHAEVVEDLDGDGIEQTGWTVLYMHIETRDRIAPGTQVNAGDHIGHPSCEGGVSNGTHTHIARRYNGEWIPADGQIPFNLDGWISSGTGIEYNGFLTRNGQEIEAWDDRRSTENEIQR